MRVLIIVRRIDGTRTQDAEESVRLIAETERGAEDAVRTTDTKESEEWTLISWQMTDLQAQRCIAEFPLLTLPEDGRAPSIPESGASFSGTSVSPQELRRRLGFDQPADEEEEVRTR